MRLAMRLPSKKGDANQSGNLDPREQESAEVIDLASRSGFSPVADRKSKTDGLALAGLVAVVGVAGAISLWATSAADQPVPAQNVGTQQPAPATTPAAEAAPQAAEVNAPVPAPVPAPAPVYAASPVAATGPRVNPLASPSLVYDASGAAVATTAQPVTGAVADPATSRTGDSGAGGPAAAFASRIGGVGGAPAQAIPMTNPSTTVTKGTMIPAVLETAINTDVPGFVRAVVSQDVRSFDGKNVLIPRSSRLIGQYQSGVQQGQRRAYVIWTDLIRPDGASVQIQSPAVGFDGTTGLAGDVDTHFFSRFGSSILLSVVGGLGALTSGGTTLITGAGQSAASTALQQDGQRPPTIRVRMGEPIRVFTARPLDFSTVSN